jgi:hypothetical protein
MAFKQNQVRCFAHIFLLGLIFFLFLTTNTPSPTFASEEISEEYLHFDETDERVDITLSQVTVKNEAIIFFSFHLYANSTTNITLLIDPETEWNVTHIQVNISETVNATVTNGNLGLDPDVYARFKMIMQRKKITNEIWAYLYLRVITHGWQKTPWPVLPGILALLVLFIKRHRKTYT